MRGPPVVPEILVEVVEMYHVAASPVRRNRRVQAVVLEREAVGAPLRLEPRQPALEELVPMRGIAEWRNENVPPFNACGRI